MVPLNWRYCGKQKFGLISRIKINNFCYLNSFSGIITYIFSFKKLPIFFASFKQQISSSICYFIALFSDIILKAVIAFFSLQKNVSPKRLCAFRFFLNI